jgi:hypothetical protein
MDTSKILQLLDEAIANRELDARNGVENAQKNYERGLQAVQEFTRWLADPPQPKECPLGEHPTLIKGRHYIHYRNGQEYVIDDVCQVQLGGKWTQAILYHRMGHTERYARSVNEFFAKFAAAQSEEDFLPTTFVTILTVFDEETRNQCEIEIRKILGGPLVGLDVAYLYSIGGCDPLQEYPISPYDGTPLLIPNDEEGQGERT